MKITFKKVSVLLLILCLSTFSMSSQNSKKFKVTLDAGHGDHDPGAKYNGIMEKKVTLAIVLKIGKILEQNPNVDVIYTRKTDVFVDLIERANIANRANANIFVSIHCNANKNTAADGSETYVMGMTKNASNLEAAKRENEVITLEKDYKKKYEGFDPNKPESMIGMTIIQEEYLENSIELAGKVQSKFVSDLGRKSRGGGVKQAPYMVLHKAYMPRVLIETGFISNPTEGAYLNSEKGQNEIAQAVADAIISYKNEFYDGGDADDSNEIHIKKHDETPVKQKTEIKKRDTVTVKKDSEKKDTIIQNNALDNSTIYKVQISASPKKIELKSSNFKGLKNISSTFTNSIYRYNYGETHDLEEAKKMQKEAKDKGYTSAFIVVFIEGKNVPLKDVKK